MQMTNRLAKDIIKNYRYIIDELFKNKIILRYNDLSINNENNECKYEYCSKIDH